MLFFKRVIWQCNHKFKGNKKCSTPHIYEDKLKEAFVEAFNSIFRNKDDILKGYEEIIQSLTDTTKLDKESSKIQSELEIVTEMLRKCVEENAHSILNQSEYEERYKALAERYEAVKKELEGIEDKKLERSARHESIIAFIKEVAQREDLVGEFDEELWNFIIEKVIVNEENKITFVFKDGMEIGGIIRRLKPPTEGKILSG